MASGWMTDDKRRSSVPLLVCDFQSSHLFSTSAASQKKLPCSSAWGRSHRLFNPASAGGHPWSV